MVFSSAIFIWLFLPTVFLINLILPKEYSNLGLLLASLFFYAWGEPVYVLLMLFTIVVNWLAGLLLSKGRINKKCILAVTVLADISILGYFKYIGFLVGIINGILGRVVFTEPKVILPIGISFFTFQAISYVVDVYRGDTDASKSIVNVALYISFFPQLIAGPIVKYRDINEQIVNRTITSEGVAVGFRRFIYGLAKKVLVANVLGKSVDIIFDYPLGEIGVMTAWIGAIFYTLQIYYDFSGYSDMAIGLGKMFGFAIPENFDYPYVSRSISEFWRRWHISLGTWFREYVYIPLGGNRKGKIRTFVNLGIVFVLTGLWHGASFSFIFWGIWHGFFSIIERLGLNKLLKKYNIISHIYLLLVVNFGWVFFRVNNLSRSLGWIKQMLAVWDIGKIDIPTGMYMNSVTWVTAIIGILGCGVIRKMCPQSIMDKWKDSSLEWVYCIVILIMSFSYIAADTYNPFIYFNF